MTKLSNVVMVLTTSITRLKLLPELVRVSTQSSQAGQTYPKQEVLSLPLVPNAQASRVADYIVLLVQAFSVSSPLPLRTSVEPCLDLCPVLVHKAPHIVPSPLCLLPICLICLCY